MADGVMRITWLHDGVVTVADTGTARYAVVAGSFAEACATITRWMAEQFDVTQTQNVWAGHG